MRCPAVRQSMRWNWPGVKSDGIGTPWFRPKLPSVGAVPSRNQGENMGNTWRMLSQLAELFFLWYHVWSDKYHRFHSDFPTFLWYSSSAVALTRRCAGCGRKADGWVWALEAVGPGRQTQKKRRCRRCSTSREKHMPSVKHKGWSQWDQHVSKRFIEPLSRTFHSYP